MWKRIRGNKLTIRDAALVFADLQRFERRGSWSEAYTPEWVCDLAEHYATDTGHDCLRNLAWRAVAYAYRRELERISGHDTP